MYRKIYKDLIDWKQQGINKPLMLIGARQIGKTYILKEFCKSNFKKYHYINLFECPEVIKTFKLDINVKEKFERLNLILDEKIDFEKDVIFFDEIQMSEELISALKYAQESDINYKIVCAGSLLGVKINRFNGPFPVGKVTMLHMHPMDFEEFLMAEDMDILISDIKKCYEEMKPMEEMYHNKLLELYKLYLCTGGMPEAVNDIILNKNDISSFRKKILTDIVDSYINDMGQYIATPLEKTKIEAIYKSIPEQLGNVSNKFQYSLINTGARSKSYEMPLNWLVSSGLVNKCTLLKNIEVPPTYNEDYFKLYINDVGILNELKKTKYRDIILENDINFKGIMTENYVANQLVINGFDLYYWKNKYDSELDFIIYTDDGLIPIEVKASDNVRSRSLNEYIKAYNPKYSIRISTKNFGFENNIKSIPLYAAFCIK